MLTHLECKTKGSVFDCLPKGCDAQFADLAIHASLKEDLLSKWPNRGDSVLLDYLYLTRDPKTGSV
jgi:hypothetical protein